MRVVACVDVGSTFTKAAAVDVGSGTLLASASHPTTIATDVLDGLDAVVAEVSSAVPGGRVNEVRACSSAGGGLRLAVVGYERAVTAEAGFRVGLSAGARVVHVAAGELDRATTSPRSPPPGPTSCCWPGAPTAATWTSCATTPVGWPGPARASPTSSPATSTSATRSPRCCGPGAGRSSRRANVLPRIGVLDPQPARAAIRDVFIRHVIGGKGLSARAAVRPAGAGRHARPRAVGGGAARRRRR